MKNIFVLFILLISFSVFAETNVINVTEGKDKVSVLKDAKFISILYTFNDTKIWNKDIDTFLADRKVRGKYAAEDRIKIINDLKSVTEFNLAFGKKFGLHVIDKKEDAKEGFIFIINYDKCFSAPMTGAKCYATISVISAQELNKVIFKAEMMETMVSTGFWDALSEGQFSNVGRVFARVIIKFLNEIQ